MENNNFNPLNFLQNTMNKITLRRNDMREAIYQLKPHCKDDVKQMLDHMVQFYPDVPDCDLKDDATFLYNEVITKLKF